MQPLASWVTRRVVILLFLFTASLSGWSQETSASAGTDAKSCTESGMEKGAKGEFDAAIEAFNQAIKFDPGYAPAYYFRGFAHTQEQKLAEAIPDYDKAIQLDPKYKNAYYQRGCLKGQQADFKGALSDFNQVIKLDPKFAPAYYNSGHVLYFQGDLDQAQDKITQALSLDPDFPPSYFIRGLIRHALTHNDDAMADFQKSAGLGFPYAYYWIWTIEMEGNLRGLAHKDITDALSKPEAFKSNDWPTQIASFLAEKITQDELLAAVQVGDPSAIEERNCEAWFYIGMAKHFDGDHTASIDCFKKAIATNSSGAEEYVEARRALADEQSP